MKINTQISSRILPAVMPPRKKGTAHQQTPHAALIPQNPRLPLRASTKRFMSQPPPRATRANETNKPALEGTSHDKLCSHPASATPASGCRKNTGQEGRIVSYENKPKSKYHLKTNLHQNGARPQDNYTTTTNTCILPSCLQRTASSKIAPPPQNRS
jgi:hypothetical protein